MAFSFDRTVRLFGCLSIFCFLAVGSSPIVSKEPTLSLRLIDVETNISPVPILFLNKKTAVVVEGLGWLTENEVARKIDNSFIHKSSDDSFLLYSTFVNEHQVANGTIDLSSTWKRNNSTGFTSSIDAGVIEIKKSGQNSIRVELYSVLSGNIIESSATLHVRSYQQWKASIPILIGFGLFLVFNVHVVHSLFCAMFIGSCIVEGSMINGFRAVFGTYILQAVTDSVHLLIILFIPAVFILMNMVKVSGGTAAVIKAVRRHSSKSRASQLTIVAMGLVFFFDPYVSIMVVGKVFGSLMRGLPLSTEKFSFLIHATATPIASIFPKSSWISFVGNLIQTEIDNMIASGNGNIGDLNGHSLALSTVAYQFYPSLVLGLVLLQILTRREMGPILKAENQARFNFFTIRRGNGCDTNVRKRKWNWYIPVVVLNMFLWIAFACIGIDGESQAQSSLAAAWLTSTVATIIIAQFVFILQRRDGKVPLLDYFREQRERTRLAYLTHTFPSASSTVSIPYNLSSKSEDSDGFLKDDPNYHLKILKVEKGDKGNEEERNDIFGCLKYESLLSLDEGIACMVEGIGASIPITLSLVFVWATASVYISLGVDRVIMSWILSDNVSEGILPLVVFLNAFLLSIITGSSWSCVSILIPGMMSHLVESQEGDSNFLVLVLASLLSGAVAGDHIGPFSETTILSALVSGIKVRQHFLTQMPYATFVLVLSVLVGTLPSSYDNYPSYVGHFLGIAVIALFIILVCRRVEQRQSTIPGQIRDDPITQNLHAMVTRNTKTPSNRSATIAPRLGVNFERQYSAFNLEDVSLIDASTLQGTEVVPRNRNQMQNNNHVVHRGVHVPTERELNLEDVSLLDASMLQGTEVVPRNRNRMQNNNHVVHRGVHVPTERELNLEDVSLLDASMLQGTEVVPRNRNRVQTTNNMSERGVDVPTERELHKKRLIEATIKKAEEEGNVFSDSMRLFLRTAEQKLGNVLERNKNKHISRTASADSTGGDSLDNLMLDIASKGWQDGINMLLEDVPENSTRGDGGLETDDSRTATSYTLGGNGQSTYFTEHDQSTYFTGHDQSTYFTGHDQSTYFSEATSCEDSATEPSEFTDISSQILKPANFNEPRYQRHGLDEEQGFSSSRTDDIFSAAEYTQGSF